MLKIFLCIIFTPQQLIILTFYVLEYDLGHVSPMMDIRRAIHMLKSVKRMFSA